MKMPRARTPVSITQWQQLSQTALTSAALDFIGRMFADECQMVACVSKELVIFFCMDSSQIKRQLMSIRKSIQPHRSLEMQIRAKMKNCPQLEGL